MQNSFEKQVKDKMEELRFHPTDPVWLKVEAQIRRKKSRRRFLFWLFPLLLALGGGAFWMINGGIEKEAAVSYNEPAIKQENTTSPSATEESREANLPNEGTRQSIEKRGDDVAPQLPDPSYKPGIAQVNNEPSDETVAPHAPVMMKNEKPAGIKQSNPVEQSTTSGDGNNDRPGTIPASPSSINQPAPAIAKQHPAIPGDKNKVDEGRAPLQQKTPGDTSKTIGAPADSSLKLIKDSVVVPALVKKEASSNWAFGVSATAGISGAVSGLDPFAEEREFSFDPTAGGSGVPNQFNQGSQPVRNSLYFSVGVEATRRLSPRVQLKAGLRYEHYSTKVKVGQFLRQDTVISSGGNLDQFYSNTGGSFSDYTNKYHFISLPLSLQWKVHQNIPLFLEGGISVQQLLSTNALLFDPVAKVYYSDDDAMNRTAFFMHAGLSYAVISKKKVQLNLGPKLQYGLTRISKNGSDKHLVALGLSASLQFQK